MGCCMSPILRRFSQSPVRGPYGWRNSARASCENQSETQRISLGMKQLNPIPGMAVSKFELKGKVTGRVTNITDYGALVELDNGIEGLVHVSE